MDTLEYIGRFVKIYLKNGHIFHGSVIFWSDENVRIKSIQNEIIIIRDTNDISAYIFVQKPNGQFLVDDKILNSISEQVKSEKNELDESEKDVEKDNLEIKNIKKIKDLIPLYNLRAEAERQAAKEKVKSPITTSSVEYGDPISILRTFKNDSSE